MTSFLNQLTHACIGAVFIVAFIYSIKKNNSLVPGLRCDDTKALVKIDMNSDIYAHELKWTLRDSHGDVLLKSSPYDFGVKVEESYLQCVDKSTCIQFKIDDIAGDGVCCDFDATQEAHVHVTWGHQDVMLLTDENFYSKTVESCFDTAAVATGAALAQFAEDEVEEQSGGDASAEDDVGESSSTVGASFTAFRNDLDAIEEKFLEVASETANKIEEYKEEKKAEKEVEGLDAAEEISLPCEKWCRLNEVPWKVADLDSIQKCSWLGSCAGCKECEEVPLLKSNLFASAWTHAAGIFIQKDDSIQQDAWNNSPSFFQAFSAWIQDESSTENTALDYSSEPGMCMPWCIKLEDVPWKCEEKTCHVEKCTWLITCGGCTQCHDLIVPVKADTPEKEEVKSEQDLQTLLYDVEQGLDFTGLPNAEVERIKQEEEVREQLASLLSELGADVHLAPEQTGSVDPKVGQKSPLHDLNHP